MTLPFLFFLGGGSMSRASKQSLSRETDGAEQSAMDGAPAAQVRALLLKDAAKVEVKKPFSSGRERFNLIGRAVQLAGAAAWSACS